MNLKNKKLSLILFLSSLGVVQHDLYCQPKKHKQHNKNKKKKIEAQDSQAPILQIVEKHDQDEVADIAQVQSVEQPTSVKQLIEFFEQEAKKQDNKVVLSGTNKPKDNSAQPAQKSEKPFPLAANGDPDVSDDEEPAAAHGKLPDPDRVDNISKEDVPSEPKALKDYYSSSDSLINSLFTDASKEENIFDDADSEDEFHSIKSGGGASSQFQSPQDSDDEDTPEAKVSLDPLANALVIAQTPNPHFEFAKQDGVIETAKNLFKKPFKAVSNCLGNYFGSLIHDALPEDAGLFNLYGSQDGHNPQALLLLPAQIEAQDSIAPQVSMQDLVDNEQNLVEQDGDNIAPGNVVQVNVNNDDPQVLDDALVPAIGAQALVANQNLNPAPIAQANAQIPRQIIAHLSDEYIQQLAQNLIILNRQIASVSVSQDQVAPLHLGPTLSIAHNPAVANQNNQNHILPNWLLRRNQNQLYNRFMLTPGQCELIRNLLQALSSDPNSPDFLRRLNPNLRPEQSIPNENSVQQFSFQNLINIAIRPLGEDENGLLFDLLVINDRSQSIRYRVSIPHQLIRNLQPLLDQHFPGLLSNLNAAGQIQDLAGNNPLNLSIDPIIPVINQIQAQYNINLAPPQLINQPQDNTPNQQLLLFLIAISQNLIHNQQNIDAIVIQNVNPAIIAPAALQGPDLIFQIPANVQAIVNDGQDSDDEDNPAVQIISAPAPQAAIQAPVVDLGQAKAPQQSLVNKMKAISKAAKTNPGKTVGIVGIVGTTLYLANKCLNKSEDQADAPKDNLLSSFKRKIGLGRSQEQPQSVGLRGGSSKSQEKPAEQAQEEAEPVAVAKRSLKFVKLLDQEEQKEIFNKIVYTFEYLRKINLKVILDIDLSTITKEELNKIFYKTVYLLRNHILNNMHDEHSRSVSIYTPDVTRLNRILIQDLHLIEEGQEFEDIEWKYNPTTQKIKQTVAVVTALHKAMKYLQGICDYYNRVDCSKTIEYLRSMDEDNIQQILKTIKYLLVSRYFMHEFKEYQQLQPLFQKFNEDVLEKQIDYTNI